MSERVVVVGAGVVGLSCAVRLAEAGYDTQVFARDLPLETTSAVAGGLWLPQGEQPATRVAAWAGATLREMTALADDDETGVRMTNGTMLYRADAALRPAWASTLGEQVGLEEVSRPLRGYASGWHLRVPVVDPHRYLPWLTRRLADAGGSITRMPLSALPPRGIVVNASGASARALAADKAVVAGRGQVVVMSNPGLRNWWADEDPGADPLYVIPRGDHVVVGGSHDLGDWGTTAVPQQTEHILRRAIAMEPRLEESTIRAVRVGLRPMRPHVRLDLVEGGRGTAHRRLVHVYGHGAAGWTMSWGCADEVLTQIQGLQQHLF